MRTTLNIHLTFALAFALLSTPLISQEMSAIDLLASDSYKQLVLTTDMKKLVKDKREEEYQPAVLEIMNEGGESITMDIDVRSRGNIRKEACYYPPIRFKFPKEQYEHHKLKLVISCRDSELYDQILLKEYMAYQIFEILSETGFKSELLRIKYIDTGRDGKEFERFAFVLENQDALAGRLGGRVYEPKVLRSRLLGPDQMALFTIFQYMVANTDWAFANRHNMEAITDPSTNTILAVPYDFDYSGFVGTSYAIPNESVPIKSVSERYNKGVCLDTDSAEKMRNHILSKQDEITAMVNDFEYFTDRTRNEVNGFLKPFFDLMSNQKQVQTVFCKNCEPEQ